MKQKTDEEILSELEKKYGNIIGWYELKSDIAKALAQKGRGPETSTDGTEGDEITSIRI